ncbi:MAG TPA: class I SAM-dependent methyltransferase [Bacteroidota bacterium]|nr:class I SAM-dependent methyltransferase [Bacteroidota bacterium]
MSEQHYTGLVAEWYDDFLRDEHADLELYRGELHGVAGPVLELGCGTGRMLLALSDNGWDVDGVDVSTDMLERCRAKAEARGFSPRLLAAPMRAFDMAKSYAAVLIAGGSLQLAAEEDEAADVLRTAHRHLRPGGLLLFDVDLVAPSSTSDWTLGRVAVRGEESVEYHFTNSFDVESGINTIQTRYRHWRDGAVQVELHDTLLMHVFTHEQILALLQQSGFAVRQYRDVCLFDAHPGSRLYIAERIH